jgi:hypothetical protein
MTRINFPAEGSKLANLAGLGAIAGNRRALSANLNLLQLLSGPWARLS